MLHPSVLRCTLLSYAAPYTVQKILSINLCSWSLCCIECKLGHYWTQKFLTSCTGQFCAAFELKHFTPNRMKKYVLLESPLPFFVMASCSYHKIILKLVSALFQSSFTSTLFYKFASLVSAFYSYHKIMVKPSWTSFKVISLRLCYTVSLHRNW
jgi:hypothetical protein